MVKDFEIAEIVRGGKTVSLTVNFATVQEMGERIPKIDFYNNEKTGAQPVIEHALAEKLNPNKQTLLAQQTNQDLAKEAIAAVNNPGVEVTQGVEGINNIAQRTGGKGAYIG